jgi:hypothetical protein
MQSTNLALPGAEDAGVTRRWYLPTNNEDEGRGAETRYYITYARFLGVGSSHTDRHSNHHEDERFVRKGVRCNACRWFEARIFRELSLPEGVTDLAAVRDPSGVQLGDYVIHYAGMSVVDGEVPFCRYETTPSPYAVIESMTTRRTTENGPVVFLAKPAAHSLAAAAEFDTKLRVAYENRAVS